MKPDEVRDLVAYLRSKEQVPMPKVTSRQSDIRAAGITSGPLVDSTGDLGRCNDGPSTIRTLPCTERKMVSRSPFGTRRTKG